MENLVVFKNEEFGEIRTLEINGEPYFVGKDVAEILGYAEPRSAVSKKVDEEDKGVSKIATPSGTQEMTIINESGLYSLILSSKLPTAKKFKRWVTSEVLPSIRKTGKYSIVENKPSYAIEDPIERAKAWIKEQEEKQKIQVELQEKNNFVNRIAISSNSVLVRELAKIASKAGQTIGEKKLWQKLRDWGYVLKNSTEPKQKYVDNGYFEVVEGVRERNGKTFTYHTTRVTGKGQEKIIKKLMLEK